MGDSTKRDLTVRIADDADLDEIVHVCGEALGWEPDSPNEAFFRWKHFENPFGRSPIWLALDEGRIVGVRTMMCWTLVNGKGDRLRMVRAVDTATLPSHQGLGIFRTLTLRAVEDLTAQGIDAVFNTPNDKSRPGYLKMGWQQPGRVEIGGRPRSVLSLPRIARSRVPADKWGESTQVGFSPTEALADDVGLQAAISRHSRPAGWSTEITSAYLRWRLCFDPLHYRIAPLGDSIGHGFVGFRIRQRGAMRELSVNEVVAPAASSSLVRRRIASLLKETRSDVALSTLATAPTRTGLLPLPRLGPILTWRALANSHVPELGNLALSLATVELF